MAKSSKKAQVYKEQYLLTISKMSNRELLDETISMGGGDDFDIGCFTTHGKLEYDTLREELEKRLETWLNEN